jgi:regulator of replication initiation timing
LLIRAQEHAEFAGKVAAQAATTMERQLSEIKEQLDGLPQNLDGLINECRTLALDKLEGFYGRCQIKF